MKKKEKVNLMNNIEQAYNNRYATTDYWVFKHDSPLDIKVDSILVGDVAYINVTAPGEGVTIEINGKSIKINGPSKLVGKEEALVYATGFTVNSGVVPCLGGREDYLLLDRLNHASIIEGSRLSMAKQFKYRHNDMEQLEKFLQQCEPDKIKLIS